MGKFRAAPLAQFLTPSAPEAEAPKPAKAAEQQPAPTKAAEPKAPAAKRQRKPKAPKLTPLEKELAKKSRAANNAKYIKRVYDYRTPEEAGNPRTRRVQLLMKPNIYTAAAELARLQGQSMNHFIENLIIASLDAADIVDAPPPPIPPKGKNTK